MLNNSGIKSVLRLLSKSGALFLILLFALSLVIGGTQFINRDNYLCVQWQTNRFDTTSSGQTRRERVTNRFDTSSGQLWQDRVSSYDILSSPEETLYDEYLKKLMDRTKNLTSPDGAHFALIANDHLIITDQRGQIDTSIPIPPDYSLFSWSPQGEYLTLIHVVLKDDYRYDFDVVNLRTHRLYNVSGAGAIVERGPSDPAEVLPAEALARWSSNGQSWLFEHHLGVVWMLMKLDADSGIVSALTGSDLIQSVVFSPTGRYAAIVRQLPEKDQVVEVVDTDTGSVKRLVDPNDNKIETYGVISGVLTAPHWTPDGQFVTVVWSWINEDGAVASFRPDVPVRGGGGLIWMHPDGSGLNTVSESGDGTDAPTIQDLPMPNGTWVAYSVRHYGITGLGSPFPSAGINIVNLQTGEEIVLVDNLAQNGSGTIYPSRDGQVFVVANVSAAFQTGSGPGETLTIITMGRSQTISYYASGFLGVTWSPNDSMIAFVTYEGLLYILRRDGTEVLHRALSADQIGYSPTWTQCG